MADDIGPSTSRLIEKVSEYDGKTGYYLKIFFVSERLNKNYWKVSPGSIKSGLETGLEKKYGYRHSRPQDKKTAPIILHQDYMRPDLWGHPDPHTMDMKSDQEWSRVGDFVAVGTRRTRPGPCRVGHRTAGRRKGDQDAQVRTDPVRLPEHPPHTDPGRGGRRVGGKPSGVRVRTGVRVRRPSHGDVYGIAGECTVHLAKQASYDVRTVMGAFGFETECDAKAWIERNDFLMADGHKQAAVLRDDPDYLLDDKHQQAFAGELKEDILLGATEPPEPDPDGAQTQLDNPESRNAAMEEFGKLKQALYDSIDRLASLAKRNPADRDSPYLK